jgi:hypothetical protein
MSAATSRQRKRPAFFRSQKTRTEAAPRSSIAVGLIRHFQGDLFLQKMRAVSQTDHLLVESVEALCQPARLDSKSRVLD